MEANGRHRSMRFVRRDAADRGPGGGPEPDPPSCATGPDAPPHYLDTRRRPVGAQPLRPLRRRLSHGDEPTGSAPSRARVYPSVFALYDVCIIITILILIPTH